MEQGWKWVPSPQSPLFHCGAIEVAAIEPPIKDAVGMQWQMPSIAIKAAISRKKACKQCPGLERSRSTRTEPISLRYYIQVNHWLSFLEVQPAFHQHFCGTQCACRWVSRRVLQYFLPFLNSSQISEDWAYKFTFLYSSSIASGSLALPSSTFTRSSKSLSMGRLMNSAAIWTRKMKTEQFSLLYPWSTSSIWH